MNMNFFTHSVDDATMMSMKAMNASQQLCESHFECEGCPLKGKEEVELIEGVKTRCER